MRTATTAHATTENEITEHAPRSSGRRIKASRPSAQAPQTEQLAHAMVDALEDILDSERRSA